MRVSEYMSHHPVSVTPHTTALEAAEKMYGGGFRHLPVLEQGKLVGIVSDRDLRQSTPVEWTNPPHHRISPERIESGLSTLEVHMLMTRKVQTIDPSATLRTAALKFSQGGFGALPVLEDGKLVGMFTMRDLLRWLLEHTRTR